MMSTQYNYAGIDIAKRNFVIAVSSLSKTKTETNNPKGIAHTIEYLKKHNVALVVMESTGGLEIPAIMIFLFNTVMMLQKHEKLWRL